ncbi:hypothetical protein GP5015_508 [gamma proteobacterium HTCC5015]|nr:hypothetical protein GP5015_508 [gamma proteobacterium HTCC5015]
MDTSATPTTIKKYLQETIEPLGHSATATLSTSDGEVFATTVKDDEKSARQSAMATALISLSESFSEEVIGEKTNESCLSAGKGHAVIVRLHMDSIPYLLCVSCDHSNNLASLLRMARDMVIKIQDSFG